MRTSTNPIRRSGRHTSKKQCKCHKENSCGPIRRRAGRRRAPNRRYIRIPDQTIRWTSERAFRIQHELRTLKGLVSNKCRLTARNCEETRRKIVRHLHDCLVFRGSRHITMKLWIPSSVFANIFLPHVREADLKWTITKPKDKNGVTKVSTASVRGNLSEAQFRSVLESGYSRNHLDDQKLAYHASILFDDENPFNYRYNIDTGMLVLNGFYHVFRIDVDGAILDI